MACDCKVHKNILVVLIFSLLCHKWDKAWQNVHYQGVMDSLAATTSIILFEHHTIYLVLTQTCSSTL